MKFGLKCGPMRAAVIMAVCLPAVAQAQPASDTQTQINALSRQLKTISAKTNALEARQKHDEALVAAHNKAARKALLAVPPTRAEKRGLENDQYVTKGVLPGSFLIPGTETSIHIGGFVNLQAEYNPTQNLGPKFSIGNLSPDPAKRRETAGDVQFNSKVSRLVVQSSTPSKIGPITTNFAIDLWGYVAGGDYNQALQNNSYSARIVYAFGTLGPFSLGMMNSNFVDGNDAPETIDFAGPAGLPAERTEQIRYTLPVNKTSIFSFAAEDPQSGYQDTRNNIEVASKTELMPDFSARYQYTSPLIHVQVSGVLRNITYTDSYGDRSSHITGAGIIGSTLNLNAINPVFGKDIIGAQYWAGSIGRYIPDDFGANVASVLAVNNGTSGATKTIETKLQNDHGFAVWYQHFWIPTLRSTLTYGYNSNDLASFLPANSANAVATWSAAANLIWQVVPSADVGVEFWSGQKKFQASTGYAPVNAEKVVFGGIWHF